MGTIFKTDLDAVAAAYLKNNVNGAINPYNSGWAPAYVNMSLVGGFTQDPAESHPSNWVNGAVKGDDLRGSMILLGQYYAWIARGHYGLLTTDANGTRYTNAGSGHFVLNGSAPGAVDHYNRVYSDLVAVGYPSGTAMYQNVINWYTYGWQVINARKDDVDVDLTVCHSSCHTSCHGSRGRR